jgi:hypothetical protein
LIAFAWREWSCHRSGECVDPIGAGILFGTNLLWSALLVCDPHPAFPLYALASGHYAQYLYFVWHVEAREQPSAPAKGPLHMIQSELRSSRLRYLVLLLAMAGAVTLLLTFASAGMRTVAASLLLRPDGALDLAPWSAAMLGINLQHYWLDHRIWRTRRPAVAVGAA